MSRSRMARIDRLLENQAADLDSLEERHLRQVLQAYDDARRELRERLNSLVETGQAVQTPATAQHLRVMLAQTEAGVAHMQARLYAVFGAAIIEQHNAALANLLATIRAAEPEFHDTGNAIEVAAIRRLSEEQGLALHRYSVDRYGRQLIEAVQRELVVGVASGLTPWELTNRVAGAKGSVFGGMRHRAELIVRMELGREYDAGHQASLDEASAVLDDPTTTDPLLKRADEFRDHRNHPLSPALHGTVARPSEEFEVPVSRIVGGSTGGIVWAVSGGVVHGRGYPAHFNDRGRQVPHRMSWEGKAYKPKPSPRAEPLTLGDYTALRALARGEQPTRLSAEGRRRLTLHRYVGEHGGTLVAWPAGVAAAGL